MHSAYRITLALLGGVMLASAHAQMQASMPPSTQHAASPADTRQNVDFPPMLKQKTLATMRMHLQGLAEIQQALAEHRFDAAAQIATMKLGMSSMHGDQMTEEARYMPPGMRHLGAQLHQQAGEFAVAAQDAAVTGDSAKPLLALSRMTQTCVACHATYRLH
ncbi:hypothetical protein [Thiomonas sp. FB-Cd]|uniref:hypothetical protein n=1 Tax=Thiomonas sp. FB-Cd TaxID=1158292 RepID=UPI00068D1CC5|nr:hypothetical protein [Thiomonas sp. FB-Cd]